LFSADRGLVIRCVRVAIFVAAVLGVNSAKSGQSKNDVLRCSWERTGGRRHEKCLV
jgi:hypothetical protein